MEKSSLLNPVYCDGEKLYNSVFALQNSKDYISNDELDELLKYGRVQISDYLVYEIRDKY